jgi:hypothetical protein
VVGSGMNVQKRGKKISFTLRVIYAVCLIGATYNHLAAILLHGVLWDYNYGPGFPIFSRIFWAALTILDPISAVLLFVRPNWGVKTTAGIIIADVFHNIWVVERFSAVQFYGLFRVTPLSEQIVFMMFVIFTCRFALSQNTTADVMAAKEAVVGPVERQT